MLSKDGTNWHCKCDCGTVKTVKKCALLRREPKGLKSCGCLQREAAAKIGREKNRKHGMKGTATYRSWLSMRNRCQNPGNVAFHKYGGRGVSVCERWNVFENFLSDVGERPIGKTLDRIDNNGNYEPSNCKWSSPSEQSSNRSSTHWIEYGGSKLTLCATAKKFGIPRDTLGYRLQSGWSVDRALREPVNISKRSKSYRRSKPRAAKQVR